MKIADLRIGMKVMGGMFDNTYEIIEITGKTCTVKHETGEKIMQGGKWEDEVFVYEKVYPKYIRKEI